MPELDKATQDLINLVAGVVTILGGAAGLVGFFQKWSRDRVFTVEARMDSHGIFLARVSNHTNSPLPVRDLAVVCARSRYWSFHRWVLGYAERGRFFVVPSDLEAELPTLPHRDTVEIYGMISLHEQRLPPIDPGIECFSTRKLEPAEIRLQVRVGDRSHTLRFKPSDTLETKTERARRLGAQPNGSGRA